MLGKQEKKLSSIKIRLKKIEGKEESKKD